jgi:hypothetical protein
MASMFPVSRGSGAIVGSTKPRCAADDLLDRLEHRVGASERHSGEIRICVEAGLPMSYLWRDARPRERAITLFGKLRVWDTEDNNGVLIYLLLAEHAIEIVADRGIDARVSDDQWAAMAQRMGAAFRERRFEDGLTRHSKKSRRFWSSTSARRGPGRPQRTA